MRKIWLAPLFFLLVGPAWGAAPTRVTGTACETTGTSTVCTISGTVTLGTIFIWGSSELVGMSTSVPTITDACGTTHGTYTTVDISSAGGAIPNDVTAQGYGTGMSGTGCAVTFAWSGSPGFVTATIEATTAGIIDVYSYSAGNTATGGVTSVATPSVTTTNTDLCISYAVDAQANGGTPTVTTFAAHDTNSVFGESNADYTQSSSGAISASWVFSSNTIGGWVSIICVAPPGGGSSVVPRRR